MTGSDPDQQLVMASTRELADSIARAATRGRNVLVLGHRGSGRTTLLNVVHRRLSERRGWALVQRVDCGPWQETRDLLVVLAAVLGDDSRNPTVRQVDPMESAMRRMMPLRPYEEVSPPPLSEVHVNRVVAAAGRRARSDHSDGASRIALILDNSIRIRAGSSLVSSVTPSGRRPSSGSPGATPVATGISPRPQTPFGSARCISGPCRPAMPKRCSAGGLTPLSQTTPMPLGSGRRCLPSSTACGSPFRGTCSSPPTL